ncbi:MAG: hypothetical protein JO202_09795 [Ktedonobacteraceae bacterium]|nr:hypothetical protein [Ktedonobacteraceae bacterium]
MFMKMVTEQHGDRKGSPLLYYGCGVYSSGDPRGHHARLAPAKEVML